MQNKDNVQEEINIADKQMQHGVYLASKARVLPMSVATLALQVLLLDDLTGRLMLKLVVLKHRVQMTWYF